MLRLWCGNDFSFSCKQNSFSQERLYTWPDFESEGFWNSEVAYCFKWEMEDKLIHPISRASFSLLEWGSPCIASSLCSRRSPKSSIFFFSGQTGFFEYEHTFIDNPRVTTEPAVPSARVLGLGSKLYPSNMLRMLNKNLNCFVQCLSWARQNRASERQVPPAENYSLSTGVFLSPFFFFCEQAREAQIA